MIRSRIIAVPLALAALALAALVSVVLAENVDPNNNGSQYAWSENAGWINAEPAGCADCGLQAGSGLLIGYMWGENMGWINMNCSNNYGPPCAGSPGGNWGVTNDGAGHLAGYAWAENAGWINFSCQTNATCGSVNYGVSINTSTGVFSGYAWGENIGWISFSDTSPVAYKVQTTGPCAAAAVPWSIPSGDPDCDGFPSTVQQGNRGPESFIGTDPNLACARTTTPNDERGPAFGEPLSPWPTDINDNRATSLQDVLMYIPVFNSPLPNPNYQVRFDLNASGTISLADVLMFIPFFNKTCTP